MASETQLPRVKRQLAKVLGANVCAGRDTLALLHNCRQLRVTGKPPPQLPKELRDQSFPGQLKTSCLGGATPEGSILNPQSQHHFPTVPGATRTSPISLPPCFRGSLPPAEHSRAWTDQLPAPPLPSVSTTPVSMGPCHPTPVPPISLQTSKDSSQFMSASCSRGHTYHCQHHQLHNLQVLGHSCLLLQLSCSRPRTAVLWGAGSLTAPSVYSLPRARSPPGSLRLVL